MSFQNFLALGLAAIVILALVVSACVVFSPTLDQVEWGQESYTVQSGDTLWGIAQRYCPDNVDCREWIDEVESINGLHNSIIRVAQEIIILVPRG